MIKVKFLIPEKIDFKEIVLKMIIIGTMRD